MLTVRNKSPGHFWCIRIFTKTLRKMYIQYIATFYMLNFQSWKICVGTTFSLLFETEIDPDQLKSVQELKEALLRHF